MKKPDMLCYNHMLKEKVEGKNYPFDKPCIKCLVEKVDILWDYLGNKLAKGYWEQD